MELHGHPSKPPTLSANFCDVSYLRGRTMTETEWFYAIKTAEKVAFVKNNVRKIHYKFKKGGEMVEEYNTDTGILSKRAWKRNFGVRKIDRWEVEVGDPFSEVLEDALQSIGIKESKDTPFVVHRITRTKLEWRIRNIPFEIQYYNINVDPVEKSIVIRTTNKKFFKKLPILELQRLNLVPQQSALKYSHYMNTLVIMYDKPPELIQFDEMVAHELNTVKCVDDGDLECTPS